MKTNKEMLEEMQGMFDTFEEISKAIKEETGTDIDLQIVRLGRPYMAWLAKINEPSLTRKFHEALYNALQTISLEISYALPSKEEE